MCLNSPKLVVLLFKNQSVIFNPSCSFPRKPLHFQIKEGCANRKNIGFVRIICYILDPTFFNLWRHVRKSSYTLSSGLACLVWYGITPVNDLQIELRVEANIFRLQVAMTVTIVLHVLDSFKKLPRQVPNLIVVEALVAPHIVPE